MAAQAPLDPQRVRGSSWLSAHPIVGAVVIAVLTGLGLQLTHLIDFEERASSLVGWTLWSRFIDFGFRMVMGVLVVLVILPYLFDHGRHRADLVRYLRHMRFRNEGSRRRTAMTTAASALVLIGLVIGLGASQGVLEFGRDHWIEDSRWFVLCLALVPAIWEELTFRGLMLSNLEQRYNAWAAIFVTSVLFGLMHFTNLALRDPSEVIFEVIMAMMLGFAWGYLTVKTRSVVPAMVLHYLVNVIVELTLQANLGDAASAAIFGGVTIAYPALTVIVVWWLARRWTNTPRPAPALGVRIPDTGIRR